MRTLTLLMCCLVLGACDRAPEPSALEPAPAQDVSATLTQAAPAKRALTGPILKLTLNWKPEPQFGGFYAAMEMEAYAKRDLNVQIVPGGSGTPVVQLVLAGQVPYGIASGDEIVIARSQGQDVVALFAVYQTCPQGILVRADRGLTKLEQVFEDGTLAIQRGLPYAMHLEKTYGLSKVQIVPYAGGIGSLLDEATGKTFAQQCFVTSEPILLKQNGVEPKAFLIAESGYDPYTTVLITRGDYFKANSSEVYAMVAAVREGWAAYLADPAPANAAMIKLNPSMDAATFAESAQIQQTLIQPPGSTADLGEMSLYRWQLLIEQLLDLGVIRKPIPAADLFLATN